MSDEHYIELLRSLSANDLATVLVDLLKTDKGSKEKCLAIIKEKCGDFSSSELKDYAKNIFDFIKYLRPIFERSVAFFNVGIYQKSLDIVMFILNEYSIDYTEFKQQWQGKDFLVEINEHLKNLLEKYVSEISDEKKLDLASKLKKCTIDLERYKINWTCLDCLK